MYNLTPRMEQNVRQALANYHNLFNGGRCSGWELEEVIAKAINADTQTGHHAKWREGGHDDKEDILVSVNGTKHRIQIKSGKIKTKKQCLTISGHRLGRFDGGLSDVTDYLNRRDADFIAIPHRKIEDDKGRQHIYRFCYISGKVLTGINHSRWEQHGKKWRTTNNQGVQFDLIPKLSWQIWWDIPFSCLDLREEFNPVTGAIL